jgi:hypothetical protein
MRSKNKQYADAAHPVQGRDSSFTQQLRARKRRHLIFNETIAFRDFVKSLPHVN